MACFKPVQYRPLITDATGREYLAGITNIRCKCAWQKSGMQGSKRWAPGWVIASAGNAEEIEPEGEL